MTGDTAPGWPTLLAARAAWRLSAGLLTTASRLGRLPRLGLAVLWLSERCAVLGRYMLDGRAGDAV
jgi:hypothetical protein